MGLRGDDTEGAWLGLLGEASSGLFAGMDGVVCTWIAKFGSAMTFHQFSKMLERQ